MNDCCDSVGQIFFGRVRLGVLTEYFVDALGWSHRIKVNNAAAKAGMDEKTARKYLRLGRAAEPVAADAELLHESGQLCRSLARVGRALGARTRPRGADVACRHRFEWTAVCRAAHCFASRSLPDQRDRADRATCTSACDRGLVLQPAPRCCRIASVARPPSA